MARFNVGAATTTNALASAFPQTPGSGLIKASTKAGKTPKIKRPRKPKAAKSPPRFPKALRY